MAALPWSHRLALLFLPLISACITDTPAEDLAGTWLTAPADLEPGWYETRLSFSVYGVFEQEVRSYGMYPGQDRNELSAYSKIKGTYRVEGDRISFETTSTAWWDPQFYGPRERVLKPYKVTLYDESRYRLEGTRLVLAYTSYPVDAPVPSSQDFIRER